MAGNYSIVQSDLGFSDQRLKDLTDDAGDTINTAKVDAAIVAAEEEFHLFAGVFYTIPVRTSAGAVPTGIKRRLIDGARWRLMQLRPEFLRNESDEGRLWEKTRKEWTDWLESIADAGADSRPRLPIPGAVELTGLVSRAGKAKVESDKVFFTPPPRAGGYW